MRSGVAFCGCFIVALWRAVLRGFFFCPAPGAGRCDQARCGVTPRFGVPFRGRVVALGRGPGGATRRVLGWCGAPAFRSVGVRPSGAPGAGKSEKQLSGVALVPRLGVCQARLPFLARGREARKPRALPLHIALAWRFAGVRLPVARAGTRPGVLWSGFAPGRAVLWRFVVPGPGLGAAARRVVERRCVWACRFCGLWRCACQVKHKVVQKVGCCRVADLICECKNEGSYIAY